MVFTIGGQDVNRLLCEEVDWSRKKFAAWVAEMLKRALLPD